MAIKHRNYVIYSAVAITVAIIIIAAIFISEMPFTPNNTQKNTGTLSVSITDAPTELTHLNITINALYVHNDNDDSWTQLNFIGGVTKVYFDLIALNNVTKELSTTSFPIGNYTKIRLDVESANATLNDGTTEELVVPPGHIDVIVSFRIQENTTTNLMLDMQVDTESIAISHSGNLKPVVKVTVQYS
jgi:hypothetical protein